MRTAGYRCNVTLQESRQAPGEEGRWTGLWQPTMSGHRQQFPPPPLPPHPTHAGTHPATHRHTPDTARPSAHRDTHRPPITHPPRPPPLTMLPCRGKHRIQCVCACSVASVPSDSLQRYGLQPTRLLCPWDSPGKKTGVGLPCPPPGDLPRPGIEPASPPSPASAGGFLTTSVTWEARRIQNQALLGPRHILNLPPLKIQTYQQRDSTKSKRARGNVRKSCNL